jgi:PDZ domain-containing protein
MSIRKLLSPVKLAGSGLFLLLLTAGVLWIVPSSDYILLPDKARPVGPLVSVKGGKEPTDGGGIYFDAVIIRRAKLFERIFPWIHEGATLVPAEQVNPPGISDSQRRREDLREMARSQDIAAAVALKYLGYKVIIRPIGALISQVAPDSPAAKAGLEPTDVIVGVDGKPVRLNADLRILIGRHRPGEAVELTIRTNDGLKKFRVGTIKGPEGRPLIGVIVEPATQVKLPIPVHIDAGSIGGPSAGLAFALDVLEELGHDVDHGYRVAATGELAADGSVVPIGGVEQKAIGVRRAEADVFLVPAGDNAAEARKHTGRVRVIPVESFRQALRVLATLPPKR